jgi:hypothetical protein
LQKHVESGGLLGRHDAFDTHDSFNFRDSPLYTLICTC